MELGGLWLAFCVLVGVYAKKLKRSGIGWFFIALFFSPLVGGVGLLIVGKKENNSNSVAPEEPASQFFETLKSNLDHIKKLKNTGIDSEEETNKKVSTLISEIKRHINKDNLNTILLILADYMNDDIIPKLAIDEIKNSSTQIVVKKVTIKNVEYELDPSLQGNRECRKCYLLAPASELYRDTNSGDFFHLNCISSSK